jgi:hypothetical protein
METNVSHYDELFPGRFLKAGEVEHSPVYTIKAVYKDAIENDKGREEPKGVIAFEETAQEIVLNKTNGTCIRAMFGDAVADWVGKRIQLVKGSDKFGKETVAAVRIGGSLDIDHDINVNVTYRRRKAKDFVMKCLKPKPKAKPVFDSSNQDQVDKFLAYAKTNGWEMAAALLSGYQITQEAVDALKELYEANV